MVGDVSGGLVAAILLIVSTPAPPTPPPTWDGLELQPAGVLSVLYTFLAPALAVTARARKALVSRCQDLQEWGEWWLNLY